VKLKHYLDILGNETNLKILRLFSRVSQEYTGRHVSKIINVHHTTGIRHLEDLCNQSILNKKIAGNAYLYYLRKNHFTDNILIPLFAEEERLYDFVLNKIRGVLKKGRCIAAAVYGSYSKLTETENSDLDLFVLSNEKNDNLDTILDTMIQDIMDTYSLEISPHIITVSEREEKKDMTVIQEIFRNGQWIFGEREAKQWLRD